MNSLEAIAAAELCSIDSALSCAALEKMSSVSGRLERVDNAECGVDDISVFIDYAHTPDAIEKLLHSVRAMIPKGSRIILLFGCGGDRDKSKRKIMGQIASRLADFVVLTSDNPRFEKPQDIIDDIKIGMAKTDGAYVEICDRKEAIRYAITHGQPGDIIVLAGKGHEDYQEIKGVKYPMDERDIVRDYLLETEK